MEKIAFLIILLVFPSFSCAQEKGLCLGDNATLECAIRNFDVLYENNYKQFWKIFHEAGDKAIACHSVVDTKNFLSIAKVKKGDGEFVEFFMEIIEKNLLLNNPQCFLDALLLLDRETQKTILTSLEHPIYLSKNEVTVILSVFKGNVRYKELLSFYF